MVKRLVSSDQNNVPLINVPTPVNSGDAVNKSYADNKVSKTGDIAPGVFQFGTGYSVSFTGDSSSYLSAGNNSAIMLGESNKPFTISMRFALASDYSASAQKFPFFLSNRYYFRIETNLKLTASVWGGTAQTSTTTLVRGTVYDATFIYDGTNGTLYLNGTQESTSSTVTTASGSGILYFGLRQGTSGSEFKGLIDSPRIWNRALTTAEVSAVANNGVIPSSGLVLELPFDDKTTLDTSSTGNIVVANNITYAQGIAPVYTLDSNAQFNVVGPTKVTGGFSASFINAPDRGAQVYNVRAYGAKGNGTADDTSIIQSVINAIATAGGGVVYFPRGSYLTTASLTLANNVRLIGDGIGVSTITGSNTDYVVLKLTGSGNSKTTYSNLSMENISVVSRYGAVATFYNITGVNIRNCEFSFSSYTAVRQSLFIQFCSQVNVVNCLCRNSAGNSISVNGVDYFEIANNTIFGGANSDDGIDVDYDFLSTSSVPSNHGTVTGNVVSGIPAGCGIRVENSNYIVVSGNEVSNITNTIGPEGGILVQTSGTFAAKHVTVTGNAVSDCVTNGICIQGTNLTNVTVSGNTVSNSGQSGGSNIRAGIALNAANVLASNNTVDGTTKTGDGSGIIAYKTSGHVINGNIIRNCGQAFQTWNGDNAQTYSNITFTNNKVSENNTNAISILGTDHVIASNMGY